MAEKIFPRVAIEAKHRAGVLGAHYDCFMNWMGKRGYAISTMRANIQSITLLGEYLEQKGIHRIAEVQDIKGQTLLTAYQNHWKSKGSGRRSSASRICI